MIKFITKEIIFQFHADLINEYGGSLGIRDEALLDSALAQPEATFASEYLHKDIFEMAAAYGYHICNNHPFIDGNKRVAFMSIFSFLYVNGWRLTLDQKEAYVLMLDVANNNIDKDELANRLRNNVRQIE